MGELCTPPNVGSTEPVKSKVPWEIGVPYGSRTPVAAVKEENHCNSMELGGMDSTLPHLKDFGGTLIGLLMDSRVWGEPHDVLVPV